MSTLSLEQLQEVERRFEALPDKPKDDMTAAHKELIKSLAGSLDLDAKAITAYFNSLLAAGKDWKYIQTSSAKWATTEKESFINNVVDNMAENSQPELSE